LISINLGKNNWIAPGFARALTRARKVVESSSKAQKTRQVV